MFSYSKLFVILLFLTFKCKSSDSDSKHLADKKIVSESITNLNNLIAHLDSVIPTFPKELHELTCQYLAKERYEEKCILIDEQFQIKDFHIYIL